MTIDYTVLKTHPIERALCAKPDNSEKPNNRELPLEARNLLNALKCKKRRWRRAA